MRIDSPTSPWYMGHKELNESSGGSDATNDPTSPSHLQLLGVQDGDGQDATSRILVLVRGLIQDLMFSLAEPLTRHFRGHYVLYLDVVGENRLFPENLSPCFALVQIDVEVVGAVVDPWGDRVPDVNAEAARGRLVRNGA